MLMLFVRLTYCIPSIVLYITVVVLLHKEKQRLFGSFYFLLIVQAITVSFLFTGLVIYEMQENNALPLHNFLYIQYRITEGNTRIQRCGCVPATNELSESLMSSRQHMNRPDQTGKTVVICGNAYLDCIECSVYGVLTFERSQGDALHDTKCQIQNYEASCDAGVKQRID